MVRYTINGTINGTIFTILAFLLFVKFLYIYTIYGFKLLPRSRFERLTYCLGGSCSILLSYRGLVADDIYADGLQSS